MNVMNGNQGLFGPMMRHGEFFGNQQHMHETGTSSVEWAILGLAIAILIGVLILLTDRCRHRRLEEKRQFLIIATADMMEY